MRRRLHDLRDTAHAAFLIADLHVPRTRRSRCGAATCWSGIAGFYSRYFAFYRAYPDIYQDRPFIAALRPRGGGHFVNRGEHTRASDGINRCLDCGGVPDASSIALQVVQLSALQTVNELGYLGGANLSEVQTPRKRQHGGCESVAAEMGALPDLSWQQFFQRAGDGWSVKSTAMVSRVVGADEERVLRCQSLVGGLLEELGPGQRR